MNNAQLTQAPRQFIYNERVAMLEAAALGATHYQLLEHYYDGAWHLGAIAMSDHQVPNTPVDTNYRMRVIAEWSAEMNKLTRGSLGALPEAGENADKTDEGKTSVSPAIPLPVDQLREEALRQHVLEFIDMELTSKLEGQVTKALRAGVLDLSDWCGVNLTIPRALATAILREAADRVIWERSHGKQAARTINNIRNVL